LSFFNFFGGAFRPLILLFFCIALPFQSFGETQPSFEAIDEAIKEAEDKKLYEDYYWETLLHYQNGWIFNRSLIDSPSFFLSPVGKTDKKAELEATVRAIFSEDTSLGDSHPQCLFPARTAWLSEKLPIVGKNLKKAVCPQFDNITSKIAPARLTLVLPFYSRGEPATAFGHTLLRLEKKNSAPLLGYSITYAASGYEDSMVFAYILKGLLGGYDGKYAVDPYSKSINSYTAIEQRDIWEYETNFTEEEVWRLYLHVWELSRTAADYYFLDENCAYNLLFILEAGRYGLKLRGNYLFFLPIDTIYIAKAGGIISGQKSIPSNLKKMESIADTLPSKGVKLAKQISQGKLSPESIRSSGLTETEQAGALDLSAELIRNRFQKYSDDNELETYKALSYDVSFLRASYSVKPNYEIKTLTTPPEDGHKPGRLKLSTGFIEESFFLRFAPRLVFHSVEDNSAGYLDDSFVEVLSPSVLYFPKEDRFKLERLRISEIKSVVASTAISNNIAWKISFNIEEESKEIDNSRVALSVAGGGGMAFKLPHDGLFWVLGEAEERGKGSYRGYFYSGFGGSAGFFIPIGDFGKFITEGRYIYFLNHIDDRKAEVSVKAVIYPTQNQTLIAEGAFSRKTNEFSLSYMVYF
jgi:hypothetical protein